MSGSKRTMPGSQGKSESGARERAMRTTRTWVLSALFLATARPAWAQEKQADAAPGFRREVRPLLSRFCFKCHGPDEKTRKAKLRLDAAGAPEGVIVPGRPDASELIARVFSADPDTIMPPRLTGRK